jgi:hypothetical protein
MAKVNDRGMKDCFVERSGEKAKKYTIEYIYFPFISYRAQDMNIMIKTVY